MVVVVTKWNEWQARLAGNRVVGLRGGDGREQREEGKGKRWKRASRLRVETRDGVDWSVLIRANAPLRSLASPVNRIGGAQGQALNPKNEMRWGGGWDGMGWDGEQSTALKAKAQIITLNSDSQNIVAVYRHFQHKHHARLLYLQFVHNAGDGLDDNDLQDRGVTYGGTKYE